jgi:hypothetical protein
LPAYAHHPLLVAKTRSDILGSFSTLTHAVLMLFILPKACTIRYAEFTNYLEEIALQAMQKILFIPGKISVVPVNTSVQPPFVFRLR